MGSIDHPLSSHPPRQTHTFLILNYNCMLHNQDGVTIEELNQAYRCIMCGEPNLSYAYGEEPPYRCQCGHTTWIHPVFQTHTDALETLADHCRQIHSEQDDTDYSWGDFW